MRKKFLTKTLAAFIGVGVFAASVPVNLNHCEAEIKLVAQESLVKEYDLNFDASKGVEKVLTYEGREIKFIAYENIVYVSKPKNVAAQSLSIYIPAEYLSGGTINGYTAKTAPIFMPNGVGGYMPGEIKPPTENDRMSHGANASLVALSRGCVVVSPAIRGRTTTTGDTYVGKAPAFIVDYKAAVRYLRYNQSKLPAGDTVKIISNGTSAGGAVSAALGSTGNAADFAPYLSEIGAAVERDDIFASSVYCPITNLDNADKAYEWIFYGENKYYAAMWQLQDIAARRGEKVKVDADSANNPTASTTAVNMTKDEIKVSKILRDAFPDYLNSLNLHDEQGNLLTLNKKGEGTFKDYIKKKYIESAQDALNRGTDLSGVTWVKIKGAKVVDVDLKKYPAAATRMKAAPAFDKMDLSSAENDEFGTVENSPRHFSEIIQKNYGGAMADSDTIYIMNPMNFIGRADVKVAPHFRIRHGAVDRDTALAVPAMLALKLQNSGVDVDFFSPWGRGHSGDYDLDLLFDWIDSICR
ncbi:MAG: alpha/beta hydrolase [Selenomonadaceae bacterium]|nr:alpha/beta hydrolase [Selenomonadaceae bacterium]